MPLEKSRRPSVWKRARRHAIWSGKYASLFLAPPQSRVSSAIYTPSLYRQMSIEVIDSVASSPPTLMTDIGGSSGPNTDVFPQTVISSNTSDLSTLSSGSGSASAQELEVKDVVKVLGQKRGRESGASVKGSAKKAKLEEEDGEQKEKEKEKGVYCHNCRRICPPDGFLRCTKLKSKSKKGNETRPCNLAFCDRDLINRYSISPQAIRWEGNEGGKGEHDTDAGYVFECPCCADECQASSCRKKKGLEPLGNLGKEAKAAVAGATTTAALLERKPTQTNGSLTTPNGKKTPANQSGIINFLDDDSDLSEPDSDSLENATTPKSKRPTKEKKATTSTTKAKVTKTKAKTSTAVGSEKGTPKPKAKKEAKGTPKTGKENKAAATAKTKTGKESKTAVKKGKDAKSATKKTGKDDKAKPKEKTKKEKAEEAKKEKEEKAKRLQVLLDWDFTPPVDPPVFEKVDTKLGREEAEQRIMLREYLFRFRPVLSIPERSLPAVDDFDRALTEANVRLFAGAMLDMIKDELEYSGKEGDDEILENMFNFREELRYYADLARFAAIYNIISEPLGLRLPPPIVDTRAQMNDSALRALLDLDENQPAPAWATDLTAGPSRRVGASRIPQPAEIIRMLLALAERTLATPKIRYDMELFSFDVQEHRKHSAKIKENSAVFEQKKKKLAEARVRCKSAAETKANKELLEQEEKEHSGRVRVLNVDLWASLSRKALRHEPIGRDVEGRIYYVLTPRHISNDGRPPIGWASGLLVWGVGVPGKSSEGDDLPVSTERWSHFGKSKDVDLLRRYVEYKYKVAIDAIRGANKPKAKGTPKEKGKSTPAKATPAKSTGKGTPAKGKATPGKATPRQKTLLEVVIPVTTKKTASASASSLSSLEEPKKHNGNDDNDDASSTSSALTPPPTAWKEELLSHLVPKGYNPTAEILEEEKKKLAMNLRDVAGWLEALEYMGWGELE
ncbi:hypothetical protein CI109_101557 [Kwoniella shandongensis]|uniref:Uncharacterized protein n=1 Tax=Kwoniella shandongensis TaxID=1734106 RepID=A0A5M6C5T5_9TREE|nr:uncharacterized protein CI109_001311 [Kwoniella shandongensis]KAA5530507.1 hypothetical protein CI109_001311 [Kwoniella shandongensis]